MEIITNQISDTKQLAVWYLGKDIATSNGWKVDVDTDLEIQAINILNGKQASLLLEQYAYDDKDVLRMDEKELIHIAPRFHIRDSDGVEFDSSASYNFAIEKLKHWSKINN